MWSFQSSAGRRFVLSAFFLFSSYAWAGEDNPLVDIHRLDPTIQLEIKYATADNFMKQVLYPQARCLMRSETAQRLLRVQYRLRAEGLSLKIFDGYRPLSVQKKMWAKFPLQGFIANPDNGSNHNRGAAVDCTLVDLKGRELEMPSAYDEFSERAHRDFQKATSAALANRKRLQEAMEGEGFKGLPTEWWHFDDPDAKLFPVLDLDFSSVLEQAL
jgi:D-alanyl-D-alanine dipeptidase